jgi:hypothetical protein
MTSAEGAVEEEEADIKRQTATERSLPPAAGRRRGLLGMTSAGAGREQRSDGAARELVKAHEVRVND